MEKNKAAPRGKSTQKSMAKSTTIQSERGATGEAMGDTEGNEGAYRGSPSLEREPSDTETVKDDDMVLKAN